MSEAEALLRLALATAFGALLGLEREERDKPAGIRTFSIVALGSALFSLISIMTFGINDAGARIPAQVVTGVGIPLGADTIIVQRGNVVGLTTAAGIWAAAAVGMGFGFGLYLLSAGSIVILLVVLRIMGRVFAEHGPAHGGANGDTDDASGGDGSLTQDGVASHDDDHEGEGHGRRGSETGG